MRAYTENVANSSLSFGTIFTPVISDLCIGQQMELAVKTLDP